MLAPSPQRSAPTTGNWCTSGAIRFGIRAEPRRGKGALRDDHAGRQPWNDYPHPRARQRGRAHLHPVRTWRGEPGRQDDRAERRVHTTFCARRVRGTVAENTGTETLKWIAIYSPYRLRRLLPRDRQARAGRPTEDTHTRRARGIGQPLRHPLPAITAALLASTITATGQQAFKSRTDVVTVPVTVTNRSGTNTSEI